MSNISVGYDDLLDIPEHHLRNRIVAVAVVAAIVAAASYGAYARFFSGGTASQAPVFAEGTVSTGAVTKTISTSGTVAASATSNLNFSSTGSEKVTKVNVAVGQAVKQGDVLAEVDATDSQNALKTAQASLASAQANLQQTLSESTAAQLASADQTLVQAQTGYNNALNALQSLQQPPTAAALGAAQQAVTAAQAGLQTA